jgi:hypothetical protein
MVKPDDTATQQDGDEERGGQHARDQREPPDLPQVRYADSSTSTHFVTGIVLVC